MRGPSSAPHPLVTGRRQGRAVNPAAPLLEPALLAAAFPGLRSSRPVSVSVSPNGSAVVRHTVLPADGRARTVVATTDSVPGATVLESDGLRVALWAWPHDPRLPGLARVDAVLRGLGREAPLKVRGYRPGRRAVLQVGDTYVKVVRPSAVQALVERHAALAGHLPVPEVLHATDDGVVVIPTLPGRPWQPGPGGYAQLSALLDALPAVDRPARGHLERVGHFTSVLRLTVPEVPVDLAFPEPGESPREPVHGDLHEGQILMGDSGITGLLDVDTVGLGDRADDWATLLAHLAVRGRDDHGLRDEIERRIPRAHLRPRVAAALLGLATGPYRVQQRDAVRHTAAIVGLAARWADEARTPTRREPDPDSRGSGAHVPRVGIWPSASRALSVGGG